MRTTLDLPDELLRRAKICAVERGMTLRELVSVALDRELARDHAGVCALEELPALEVREDCPLLRMTPEDLKDLQSAEEAEVLLAIHRRR
jgi:hypothetical protein